MYRCAVIVGAGKTTIALVAADSPEVIFTERPYTELVLPTQRPAGQALTEHIMMLLRQHDLEPGQLLGIGIGIPGTVMADYCTVYACPNLSQLDGVVLGFETEQAIGRPVFVNNNVNLIALGEYTAGIDRDVRTMATVFIDAGLGCGLIIDGSMYRGPNGAAGELGHIIIVPHGRLCSCGAHGCLEMYCSGKALKTVAKQLYGPRELYAIGARYAEAKLLIERALAGDTRAQEALTEAFTFLGIGLTSLVNLFNPELIVLTGLVRYWPEGIEIAKKVVFSEALPAARASLLIELSKLHNLAGVLGGAAFVSLMLQS
ncbi:MAG: ROK family protein [Anaerolineae bacterium]